MKIEKVIVGPLDTNCYILSKNNKCVIIDPGDNFKLIKAKVNNKEVVTILITHFHFDHIGALDELLNYYHVKVNEYEKLPNMKVIKTPGHTKDSVSYYFPEFNVIFCGDFIFKDAFGRLDLGGDAKDMLHSLEKLEKYDKKIHLYPGHGESSTLEKEISNFNDYKQYIKNLTKM